MRLIIFFICCVIFTSCNIEAGIIEEGIGIGFRNRTNTTFERATMYVGAIKNNQFIVTDSIKSKGLIEINNIENEGEIGFKTWNPNLKKVFKIANEGALFCDIKGGLKLFFEPFDKAKFGRFNRLGGGTGLIFLDEDGSYIYSGDNIEKQGFEVVK